MKSTVPGNGMIDPERRFMPMDHVEHMFRQAGRLDAIIVDAFCEAVTGITAAFCLALSVARTH